MTKSLSDVKRIHTGDMRGYLSKITIHFQAHVLLFSSIYGLLMREKQRERERGEQEERRKKMETNTVKEERERNSEKYLQTKVCLYLQ